jgi:hypothetical protein
VAEDLSPVAEDVSPAHQSSMKTDWNSNIDSAIFDKEALAKILQDPNNEIEKKWKRSILIENTPRGNVIVYYDVFKHAFAYYCDQSVMPYDIMNAVAMKYVMTFRCRDFFVDSRVFPKEREEEDKSEKEPIHPSASQLSSSHSVGTPHSFAKFKTYNMATKKIVDKKEEKTINRFLHLGGVRNWSPIPLIKKQNPINGFKTELIPDTKKLSYLDYKNKL